MTLTYPAYMTYQKQQSSVNSSTLKRSKILTKHIKMRGAAGPAAGVLSSAGPSASIVDADGSHVSTPEVAIAGQSHPLRFQQATLVAEPCHLDNTETCKYVVE